MAESSLQEHGLEMLFRADSCISAATRDKLLRKKVIFYTTSVCLWQGYSHFIVSTLLLNQMLREEYISLNFLRSRKNMFFFWDLLAHACGLVAWYKKSFSHRLTFKHTLKSHGNQGALEAWLKLSVCAMLCCKRAVCLGRYLMLRITWMRQTVGGYLKTILLNTHIPSLLNRLSAKLPLKYIARIKHRFQWKLLVSHLWF